jgi:primary-amine oxidase
MRQPRDFTIPNAICIHEEDYGILWKHTDRRMPNAPQVRRSRRLVISSISTVENYEYGFFWYFYQDGNIQFEIKAHRDSFAWRSSQRREPEAWQYCRAIAVCTQPPAFLHCPAGCWHRRIHNTVQQVDVVPDEITEANPFENGFHTNVTDLKTEKEAVAHLNLESGRTWKFVNPSSKNVLGEPVGYKFFPGDNAFSFASPRAWWRRRAGFVNHHVWVTPYRPDEKYASGDFPNQSRGGDGLEKWTQDDRPIENSDVVFWYTFGHTHIPRPEDCPVMPTAYIGFLLKPNGFFDENPANDVPPSLPSARDRSCEHC